MYECVVHVQQFSDGESEAVFGRINGRLEVSHFDLMLFDKKLDLSSIMVLSVPVHGLAAHAGPSSQAALQSHGTSGVRELTSRLEYLNGNSCKRGGLGFSAVHGDYFK